MDLGGGNDDTVELQVEGCAGVVDHRDVIAQVRRRPSDTVDAHVAHAADDDQLRNTVMVEEGLQFGFAECIDEVLEHHRFIGLVEDLGMQLRA